MKRDEGRCAIYMKADPFMKKDLDTVRQIQKVYRHVDIILDRKWQNKDYTLGFKDRADIVRHDLKEAGIEDYCILPNDTSKYQLVAEEGIRHVAVEVNKNSDLNDLAEREALAKSVIPDVNVLFIPQFGEGAAVRRQLLYDAVMEDSSRTLYKNYMSDYAYVKTKFRLMQKIGITGNRGCGLGIVIDQFTDRGYDVIDLDQDIIRLFGETASVRGICRVLAGLGIGRERVMSLDGTALKFDKDRLVKLCMESAEAKEACVKYLYDSLYVEMAKRIMESTRKIIVISSTLLFEFKIDWMFDRIITVTAPEKVQTDRLRSYRGYSDEKLRLVSSLHLPISEKAAKSDYQIDGGQDEDATVRNTVNLINRKIERGF